MRRRNLQLLNSSKFRIQKDPRNQQQYTRTLYFHNLNFYNSLPLPQPKTSQKTLPCLRHSNISNSRNLLHLPPSHYHQSILPILHDNRYRQHPSPRHNNRNKKSMKIQIKAQPNSSRQEIQTNLDGKITKVFGPIRVMPFEA